MTAFAPRLTCAGQRTPARRLASAWSVLALLLVAVGVGVAGLAGPARAAAEAKVITITAEGVSPKQLAVSAGDTVVFRVSAEVSPLLAFEPSPTTANWSFDSPPLRAGDSYPVPTPITAAGTYGYQVARMLTEEPPFTGSVVLAAPATTTSPSPGASPSASASPKTTAKPKPEPEPEREATASPSPSRDATTATGGSGTAGAPPLSGGLSGGLGPVAGDTPVATGGDGVALPPALAPVPGLLPALPQHSKGPGAGPAPATAPLVQAAPRAAPAVPGDLAGPPTSRGLGLPAALAAVLAAGTASLLVRLLLAEPAARRPGAPLVPVRLVPAD